MRPGLSTDIVSVVCAFLGGGNASGPDLVWYWIEREVWSRVVPRGQILSVAWDAGLVVADTAYCAPRQIAEFSTGHCIPRAQGGSGGHQEEGGVQGRQRGGEESRTRT
eukprot:2452936-Rhodomonas_salina.2